MCLSFTAKVRQTRILTTHTTIDLYKLRALSVICIVIQRIFHNGRGKRQQCCQRWLHSIVVVLLVDLSYDILVKRWWRGGVSLLIYRYVARSSD